MTELDEAPAREWHLITCEFPPQVGGVSDYSLALAEALASKTRTHVWCPSDARDASREGRAQIHPEFGQFSPRDLRRVGAALDALPAPRCLFVQWVPHGYGYRSLNLYFAVWLMRRAWRHHDRLDIMVHEPFNELSAFPRLLFMALMHRLMLTVVCAGASRVWTSTPSWLPAIKPYVPRRITPRWLPVPAPQEIVSAGASDQGSGGTPDQRPVVGHFGTHSPLVTKVLEPALDIILERSNAVILLIGRDSDRFRSDFLASRPAQSERVRATGTIAATATRGFIDTCDVMLQPYPDGVSARRTSTLALVSASKAVVTNAGRLTETFWRSEEGVEMVDAPDGPRLGQRVVELLSDTARRAKLARHGRDMYDRIFDLRHGLAALMSA